MSLFALDTKASTASFQIVRSAPRLVLTQPPNPGHLECLFRQTHVRTLLTEAINEELADRSLI
jgi:hypothetical protein